MAEASFAHEHARGAFSSGASSQLVPVVNSFGDGLALRVIPPRSQGVRLPLRGELGEVGCSVAVSGGVVGTVAPRAEIMDLVSSLLPVVVSSGVEVNDIKRKPPGRGRRRLLRGRKLSKALAKLS